MSETGSDAGKNDVSRQIRAPYRGGTRRSYYGDAFQTEGESAYQRLQRDAAQGDFASYAPSQTELTQKETTGSQSQHPETSSAYRSPHVRSTYERSASSSSARRTSSPSRRRTSLRRETVSSLGYEPGQGSRPSSFVNEAPIDNEYSSLGTAGAANHGSWKSSNQEKMPTMRSPRPGIGVFVGAVVAIVVVVIVALIAMSVGR